MFSALMRTPAGYPPGEDGPTFTSIPDTTDLNALHEIEKSLSDTPMRADSSYTERMFYAEKLGSITCNDNGRGWIPLSNDDCFPIAHASALQREEALAHILQQRKERT